MPMESLSAPAAAGGVMFDITTSPNSATAPDDYTTKTLTSQSIPAGSSSYVAGAGYRLLVGSMLGGGKLAVIDVAPVSAFTSIAPPGVYDVRVVAFASCGASTPSNSIVVSVDPLEPPGNLTALVTGSEVAMSWGAVAGAVSYRLEAGFEPGIGSVATVSVTSAGLVVTGVPSGTYYVRVRAVNSSVEAGAPSAEIVVVVP